MEHRKFVLFGIGGVVALVIAVTISGLSSNITYYLYPTEASQQRADFPDGEVFRLAGLVVDGTLQETDDDLRFDVTDGGATISVVLVNTPPALFDEGVPVLLEGAWTEGMFRAETAIIRHDENYEVPEEGNAPAESP